MAKTPDEIVNHILGSKIGKPAKDIIGKDRMMYSTVLGKKIDIPENKITKKKSKNGRNMLVGEYEANGKKYKSYQFTK